MSVTCLSLCSYSGLTVHTRNMEICCTGSVGCYCFCCLYFISKTCWVWQLVTIWCILRGGKSQGFSFFKIPFLSVGHIILCCLGAPLSTACCTGTDATCNCNAFGLIHPVPDVCSVESVLCVSSFIVQEAVGFIFCLVLICCYSLTFFFMEGLLYYIFTAHIPFWAVNDFT